MRTSRRKKDPPPRGGKALFHLKQIHRCSWVATGPTASTHVLIALSETFVKKFKSEMRTRHARSPNSLQLSAPGSRNPKYYVGILKNKIKTLKVRTYTEYGHLKYAGNRSQIDTFQPRYGQTRRDGFAKEQTTIYGAYLSRERV